ncbi:MAG: hypothetical protein J6R42_05480 [Clostridia bacterium]|nr:hypothetical protein [Clostridia bacterium]
MYMRENLPTEEKVTELPPQYDGLLFREEQAEECPEEDVANTPKEGHPSGEKATPAWLKKAENWLSKSPFKSVLSLDFLVVAFAVLILCDDQNDDDLIWLVLLLLLSR